MITRQSISSAELCPPQIRQPDVVFCYHRNIKDPTKTQNGADLVIEVVSPGQENRHRETVEKRDLYAKAGIQEYWIVDPEVRVLTVLKLTNGAYDAAGEYGEGTRAASVLLPGFSVDVREVFAAGEGTGEE